MGLQPSDEQVDRVVVPAPALHGPQIEDVFADDAERRAARHDESQARRRVEESDERVAELGEELLDVVEDEERVPERVGGAVDGGPADVAGEAALVIDLEGAGDPQPRRLDVGGAAELDEPHPTRVREALRVLRGEALREARLARAGRTDDAHQAAVTDAVRQDAELGSTTDER